MSLVSFVASFFKTWLWQYVHCFRKQGKNGLHKSQTVPLKLATHLRHLTHNSCDTKFFLTITLARKTLSLRTRGVWCKVGKSSVLVIQNSDDTSLGNLPVSKVMGFTTSLNYCQRVGIKERSCSPRNSCLTSRLLRWVVTQASQFFTNCDSF